MTCVNKNILYCVWVCVHVSTTMLSSDRCCFGKVCLQKDRKWQILGFLCLFLCCCCWFILSLDLMLKEFRHRQTWVRHPVSKKWDVDILIYFKLGLELENLLDIESIKQQQQKKTLLEMRCWHSFLIQIKLKKKHKTTKIFLLSMQFPRNQMLIS